MQSKNIKKCIIVCMIACGMSLCVGCESDPLSKQTVEQIDSIGEVELDDEPLIVELENTYSEMTDKQKNQVKNYVDLKNARKELDILKEEESERIAESERQAEAERQERLNEIANTPPYSIAIALCQTTKDSLYSPNSFQLNSVECVTIIGNNYTRYYYKIDYSAENKLGGTVRNKYIADYYESYYDPNDTYTDLDIYEEKEIDYSNTLHRYYQNAQPGEEPKELDKDFILNYLE